MPHAIPQAHFTLTVLVWGSGRSPASPQRGFSANVICLTCP